jgi:hypothetical protein
MKTAVKCRTIASQIHMGNSLLVLSYFSIKNSSTEVIILVITFCMLNVQSSQML